MARAPAPDVTSTATHDPVSRAQRERFERDGFLILDSVGLPASVLDGAIADLEDHYEGEGHTKSGVYYSRYRIQDAWRISANVRALALSPAIHAMLAALYGRAPLPFQTLNFKLGSEQAVHSDTIHFNSMPAGFMCGVWVALEDIDMENGPLVYFPGSQLRDEITLEDVADDPGERNYPRYERYIFDLIEREGLEPAYGTLEKGQALIWSANLLHGGMPLKDGARTRHSQVTHFFFEGCRYYTPLKSGEGQIEWRDPVWVSEEAATRPDGELYDPELVRATVASTVPEGAIVLVMSRGDEELLRLPGRDARHFPRGEDGSWIGYHPETDDEVVTALDRERALGAAYLVLPSASFWWLDHYPGFAQALRRDAYEVARDDQCLIFALGRPAARH
jgi:Phytanoyl-CoA dioxygenase (PhyH)